MRKKKKNNNTKTIIIVIIVSIIIISIICVIGLNGSVSEKVEERIREIYDNPYYRSGGFVTKYAIGDIYDLNCDKVDKDGKGRYLVKCDISYAPYIVDSDYAPGQQYETIYAVYLKVKRDGEDEDLIRFNKSDSASFKISACWEESTLKEIECYSK